MNMPGDAFLTALYTLVDDWYQAEGQRHLAHKPGAKPCFSDSEVITLSLAQHWCGFQKEREWLRFIHQNYRPLFPRLLSQSEFNRRARNLCWLINALRQWVLKQLDAYAAEYRLIDSTPIHVRHWRRYGPTHLMLPAAADEREAALDLLAGYRNRKVLGDKGFLDQFRQAMLRELSGNQLLTPKR